MKFDHKLGMLIAVAGTLFVAGCCCCSAPEPPTNGVQIQMDVSNLSDAEVDELKSKLADIAGNDTGMSTVINGSATWNYTTDLEPQAFADQIDFATVTSVVDRVIMIEASQAGDGTADGTADAAADGTADETADSADAAADGTADGTADAAADSSNDDGTATDGEPATDDGN